jgi:hypothetical protein
MEGDEFEIPEREAVTVAARRRAAKKIALKYGKPKMARKIEDAKMKSKKVAKS